MSVPLSPAGFRSRITSLLPTRADLASARRHPRRDLLAGLTVAVVALPLALGFGVSSGLGAEAGLATAVIAGALAAVFGGSNLQVSGPTGAMTVVLVPIVADHGPGGVLTVGLMAGSSSSPWPCCGPAAACATCPRPSWRASPSASPA